MTGLFFGSFNPVHTGHLIVAEYMRQHARLKEIWFVVSPQNPLKKEHDLLNEVHRLDMVRLAVKDNIHFSACDIEFHLDKPSYTIHTLEALAGKYPRKRFALIMGADNLRTLERWKDYGGILQRYPVLVYHRGTTRVSYRRKFEQVTYYHAPHIEISSTHIRNMVSENRSIRYLVPDRINRYILKNRLYKDFN